MIRVIAHFAIAAAILWVAAWFLDLSLQEAFAGLGLLVVVFGIWGFFKGTRLSAHHNAPDGDVPPEGWGA